MAGFSKLMGMIAQKFELNIILMHIEYLNFSIILILTQTEEICVNVLRQIEKNLATP